jgi:two-component system response regulator GlrR
VVEIVLPPLRDRKEDIAGLVSYFIKRYSKLHKKEIKGIRDDAVLKLLQYSWPGNVRELENIIHEAVVTNGSGWINGDDLKIKRYANSELFMSESFKYAKEKAIENFEKTFLEKTLQIFNGNIKQAANYAQKDRRAFYNLLNKHEIDPSEFRP